MRTAAAITDGQGDFVLDEIEVKEPLKDEVLVQMKASGVCRTDHDALRWGPSILGHEGAGVVVAAGPDVTTVKPGDAVVLNWAIPCGKCFQCLKGNHICCESKSRHAGADRTLYRGKPFHRCFNLGTMSGHTVVREAAVVKIHVDIPFTSACLLGCGVMTGYGSVVNVAGARPGESVVVIGAGGVGLSVIQGARIVGAGTIIAIDINADHLDLAREFGATHVILARRDDKDLAGATKEVRAATGGRGADYAFECTGVPTLSIVAPLSMVRPAGKAYLLSNIEHDVSFSMLLFTKDRSYQRPTYGGCRPSIDFPILLDLYAKGELKLDQMVTRTYPFSEIKIAFKDMLEGKNARGVVIF